MIPTRWDRVTLVSRPSWINSFKIRPTGEKRLTEHPYYGIITRLMNLIPILRPFSKAKPHTSRVYVEKNESDQVILRGEGFKSINLQETNFVALYESGAHYKIEEVLSDTEMVVKQF